MKKFRQWRTLPYEALPQWKTPRVCVITGSAEEIQEVLIQAEGTPKADGTKPTYELTVTLANKVALATKACLGAMGVFIAFSMLSILMGSLAVGVFCLLLAAASGAAWYLSQPQLIAAEDGLRISCFAAGVWSIEESIERAVTGRNPLIPESGAPRFFVTKQAAKQDLPEPTHSLAMTAAEAPVITMAQPTSPTIIAPALQPAPKQEPSLALRPSVTPNKFLPRAKAARERKAASLVVDLTDPNSSAAAIVEEVPTRIDRMAPTNPIVAATTAAITSGAATPDVLATLSLDEQLAVFEGTHPKQLVEWAQKSQALFPIHAQCAAAHAWMEKALLAGSQSQAAWTESMNVANRCLQSAAMIDPHDPLLVRLQVIEAFMLGLDASAILTRVRSCVPHAVTPAFTTEMAVRLGPLQGGSVGLALTALNELTTGLAADHPARVGFLVLHLEALDAQVDTHKVDSINAANVFLASRMSPQTADQRAFVEFATELASRTGQPAPTGATHRAPGTHSGSEARRSRFGRRHPRTVSTS